MRQASEKSRLPRTGKKLILAPPGALIMRASCLVTEGCLYSIFRHETGSGGRGMTCASEMRAHGPAVEAADVPARQPRATGPRDGRGRRPVTGRWPSDLGLKRWLGGLPIRKERQGCLKGKTTGGAAEQTYQTPRAGRHRTWRTCGTTGLRQASMSRGVEARGSIRTLGVPRALGFFRGRRKMGIRPTRGRSKNTGGGALAV